MATKIAAVVALLLTAFFASAESFWDGGAALQRGDASFESGFFAASNSFPAGTEIVVENLETGRTTKVVVSQRVNGQSDLLVLLSPKAAAALGISQGDVAPVRVTIKTPPPAVAEARPNERPLSTDSDRNPAAALSNAPPPPREAMEPSEALSRPETPKGVLESLQAAKEKRGTRTAELPPPAQEPVIREPEATPPPAGSATAQAQAAQEKQPQADEELLKKLASRTPQKQLFLPPREDEKFVYQAPAVPPTGATVAQQPQAQQPPAVPEIATVNGQHVPPAGQNPPVELAEAGPPIELNPQVDERFAANAVPPQEAPLGAPPEPEQPAPETGAEEAAIPPEISNPAPTPPASGTETVITLEPTSPKPPEAGAQVAQKPPEERPQAKPPAQAKPAAPPGASKTIYFLQLGAYVNEKQARDLASTLPPSYPVSVLGPGPTGRQIFRIMLGPLNRAESGTLLYWFKDRGFPDAFIRTE